MIGVGQGVVYPVDEGVVNDMVKGVVDRNVDGVAYYSVGTQGVVYRDIVDKEVVFVVGIIVDGHIAGFGRNGYHALLPVVR